MEERIVVSLRVAPGPGRPFLERGRSLVAKLTAFGGLHIGWGPTRITFAFEVADLQAVLEALAEGGPETEGDEAPWAVGIAQGPIENIREEGSPLLASGALWWGAPIVVASALSDVARPGEVLCADGVALLHAGDLVTLGVRTAEDGALRVKGALVDLGAARERWRSSPRLPSLPWLERGDIGDTLRVLRRAREDVDPGDVRRQCQASLALAVALSVAGRPQEALLEGMDALARARRSRDDRGARACLAFLTKLYASVSREVEAARLRAIER